MLCTTAINTSNTIRTQTGAAEHYHCGLCTTDGRTHDNSIYRASVASCGRNRIWDVRRKALSWLEGLLDIMGVGCQDWYTGGRPIRQWLFVKMKCVHWQGGASSIARACVFVWRHFCCYLDLTVSHWSLWQWAEQRWQARTDTFNTGATKWGSEDPTNPRINCYQEWNIYGRPLFLRYS